MSHAVFSVRSWSSALVLAIFVLVAAPTLAQDDAKTDAEIEAEELACTRKAVAYAEKLGAKAVYHRRKKVMGTSMLRGLDFSRSGLADSDLPHLRDRINQLYQMEFLDLSNTRVTDGGLPHLAGLESVNTVKLAGTRVTTAGLARLAQMNPDLMVFRRPRSWLYFRPGEIDGHRGNNQLEDFFSENLFAMNEPSLWTLARKDAGATSYRFCFFPSFHAPFAVRVSRTGDGATLEAVQLDRDGDRAGKPLVRKSAQLSRDQWAEIQRLVDAAKFWRMPVRPKRPKSYAYDDGAFYVFEAADRGRYHIMETNMFPLDRFADYRALCEKMVKLSGLDVTEVWNSYLPMP